MLMNDNNNLIVYPALTYGKVENNLNNNGATMRVSSDQSVVTGVIRAVRFLAMTFSRYHGADVQSYQLDDFTEQYGSSTEHGTWCKCRHSDPSSRQIYRLVLRLVAA